MSRNQEGTPEGYLLLPSASHPDVALECAAETWPVLLSLLQYHALLYDGRENIPPYLHYRLPLDSSMVEWMIQYLEVPDTSDWDTPHEGWSVLSRTYHHRYAGCMAHLVDIHVLLEAMLPELQTRWRQTLARWEDEITLRVGSEPSTLRFTGRDIHLISDSDAQVQLEVTPQALAQLAFGYRSITSVMRESALTLSREVVAALTHLFPTGHAWIAGSDWP
ncbi:MAG TPA: sterol carrier protein domain-containing protein [Ktedonobacterales bacterium]|nr:sterol carrier protein domain-containing protein [Ktedonobacterales bacterium]